MTWPTERGTYELGDFRVQSGEVIGAARLSWKSYGTLSPNRDNVIIYPTGYGVQHPDTEWLIAPDRILDPTRWFIVITDTFGNGLSSSPSNTPDYPKLVTHFDNVQAQQRLLRDRLGVHRIKCVYGFSMGAQQAYHWAALYPDAVERIIVVCGSARTSHHNKVFLAGLMAALEAAPEHLANGRFSREPGAAIRAFGRIFAGWALSQDFYRAELYKKLGAPDIEGLMNAWEARFRRRPAADLYALLQCWSASDISANERFRGNLEAALRAITARVLLMPSGTDLYFRVADAEAELGNLKHGTLRVIPSVWGHMAGNPNSNPDDEAFIREATRDWLDA